ncbi:MAG: gamma-glutamylcyclotransferase [Alphaproteobacteria bacterium]|nr:gamma-glutamylcyclotransferase [Alphaproteobacteria bacterium]
MPHRIFAYGSLMWRPDFEFKSARPARLFGYHRALSVLSHHYRGTKEKPGLVLGLDRGGSCLGLVYDIDADDWVSTIAKVREREMLGDVYSEQVKRFRLVESGEEVRAITYVVRRQSEQYAPAMSLEQLLHYVGQGHGTMGSCRAYVANTLRHLRALGIHDHRLEQLAPHVLEPQGSHSGRHA